ncbi:MAG: L-lactate dehydrogenase [Desulfovibrio sp.]|uniref:L-lactate dehydrogenase n=1 Tax=Desulfovibrio sp. 7SRBS1 TaxID=3378064 RepID=UPI003B3D3A32
METRRTKLALIGIGAVGAAFAYALSLKRLVNELVLVDLDKNRAEGEAMDLRHGLPLIGPMEITAGEYEDCVGADIVVITAGANQKPGQSRLDLLRTNTRVVTDIAKNILKLGGEPIIIVASNPVDVLTFDLLKQTGLPKNKIIGSGTVLDSSRLRQTLAETLQVDVRSVHAHVIGEHGDSELAVWSQANISCVPLKYFFAQRGVPYTEETRAEILQKVRGAAYEIIKRKGSTSNAIGVALCRIVEAIIKDEKSVLTVSTSMKGIHGLPDVCLSMPCVIGENGIEAVLESLLNDEECEALHESAKVLRKHAEDMGLV